MTIGQKLSEMRRRAGLTQDTVSESLGISPQAVSKWENDISCPDITLLPQIAKIYKTTVDELLSAEPVKDVALIEKEVRKDINDMVLHINISDGDDKVKVNLPLGIISTMTEGDVMGSINIGSFNMGNVDFKSILALVHSGVIGKLVEIESSDGATLTVEVG